MRLNKFISETGICSRRQADVWILDGRVRVNGKMPEVGTKVGPDDVVFVDGRRVGAKPVAVYIALNKPVGITCITDTRIPDNIIDFIGHPERIFPIGRLDKDSEGLILLTNNGDIVNEILRSENNHEKEYIVTVDRPITNQFLDRLEVGVDLGDAFTKPCVTKRLARNKFGIILTQGLNRQIRRMCEEFSYTVIQLQRIRVINVELGRLPLGRYRDLTQHELKGLLPEVFDKPQSGESA